MSYADIQIVAIVIVLAATYGTWVYMYSSAAVEEKQYNIPDVNYTAPASHDFFSTLNEVKELNVNNPEIFFINSILFNVIAAMLVFIMLRYARGTG